LGSRKAVFVPDRGTTPNEAAAIVTSGHATVRFLPKLQAPERLHVYATWPRGSNSRAILISVRHADGEVSGTLDQIGFPEQSGNSDQWIFLGQYDFTSGDDQWVELRASSMSGGVVADKPVEFYADAVRFKDAPLATGELQGSVSSADTGEVRDREADERAQSDADVRPGEAASAARSDAKRGSQQRREKAATREGRSAAKRAARASAPLASAKEPIALPLFGLPQLEGRVLP
jgi:hypothetical protein